MWIFLGCALAARQWERVWQRTAHGGPVPGQGQLGSGPSHGRGFVRALSARQNRLGNDDSGQQRARFWAELREGQREAGKSYSILHPD